MIFCKQANLWCSVLLSLMLMIVVLTFNSPMAFAQNCDPNDDYFAGCDDCPSAVGCSAGSSSGSGNNAGESGNGGSYGLDATADAAGLPGYGDEGTDLRTVVGKIVQVLLGFLGMIFVIIILYGGYTWMTAGGESDKVEKAIDLIRNGIIGVIIILSAYIIASFVLGAFSSTLSSGSVPSQN